jgi:type II secretory ATPase GspE/PulE/Tfp pilus assembly ATPase PilB-like protein
MDAFYKGAGCRHCRNTGFSGRIGIHELLAINDELRDAVVAGAPITALRRIGAACGMITLRHDGFRKVREGITTIEEVLRVVGDVMDADETVAVGDAS